MYSWQPREILWTKVLEKDKNPIFGPTHSYTEEYKWNYIIKIYWIYLNILNIVYTIVYYTILYYTIP